MLGDDVILMIDKNLKNKDHVQAKGGKDSSHDDDLFKYDDYEKEKIKSKENKK